MYDYYLTKFKFRLVVFWDFKNVITSTSWKIVSFYLFYREICWNVLIWFGHGFYGIDDAKMLELKLNEFNMS